MKTSRTFPVLAGMFLLLLSLAVPVRAVVINWTGNGADGSVLDSDNWDAPLTGTNDNVSFGDGSDGHTVLLPTSGVTLNNITFTGSERPTYTFDGLSGAALLGVNGNLTVDSSGGDALFESNVSIALSGATHEVSLVSGSYVDIAGVISGAGAIHKTGDGKLELKGANTFTGNLDLAGGSLLLGSNTAAGTNTLLLSSGTLAPTADIVLANAITMNGSIKLGDCDTTSDITFSGVITSTGSFQAHGYGDISFSGNNSGWSGGLSLYGANNVFVNHANGLGTGPLWFDSASTSAVHFNESSTISSLEGGYAEDNEGFEGSAIILAATKTLTIDQSSNTEYWGKIYGASDSGLSKLGSGKLTLGGPVDISGPVNVTAGTLAIDGSNEWYFNSSAVNVGSGATFALSNGASINSSVSVASGAKLIGNGYISNGTIQSGGILSPGTAALPVGEIDFGDLTLMGQSTVVIGLKSDGEGGINNSEIYVQNTTTLHLSGIDPANKLTLKLISDGVLGNLVAGNTYSLHFLYFDTQSGGVLDANNVNIDFSGIAFEAGWSGSYSLSLYTGDGNSYLVNFTPVPEPSTYALMALGLMGTGFAAWRKRRRA